MSTQTGEIEVTSKYRILLVEDDANVSNLIEEILGEEYETVCLYNGFEALEDIDEIEPDLILMDIMMPIFDGYDACRSLRKDARYANTPILVVTGISDEDLERKAGEFGIAAVIRKPFTPEQLLTQVKNSLQSLDNPREKHNSLEKVTPILEKRKQERLGNISNENKQKKQTETDALPQGLKIMVLDDDADVVKLLTSYLSKYCDVMGLVNPVDSIKQIVKYEPDVLLIDICMPTLSGYQISQLMKLNPNLKKIKVIFISSKDAPAEIDYGFQLGAFDYITKPFEPEQVLDAIHNMCDID